MTAELYRQAIASTGAVLANVSVSQLDLPTPCASWTVRDLIDHLIDAATFAAVTVETGAAPGQIDDDDHRAGDFTAAYVAATERATAAFSAEGAMEKTLKLPFADLPGSVYVLIAATDTFTHGWDLARATGQPSELDPVLAARLHRSVEGFLADSMRGADGERPFGPRVDVPATAPAADQLAGFMGRLP